MSFHLRPNTDDDQYIVKEIVDNNMYRFQDLKQYESPEYKCVVDCGAHIGIFSKHASTFFPHHHFVCFEPNADNYELLKKNMADVQEKSLFAVGVSYKEETLRLFCPTDAAKTGQCSFKPYSYLNPDKYIDVATVNLNSVINSLPGVFILKMDMEGYESIVLDHLEENNFKKVKILVLEEHDDCPIDYGRIESMDFSKLFNPYGLSRHSVYLRK